MITFLRNTFFSLIFFSCLTTQAQEKGYYRSPTIHNDIVIFTAEGDLWKYNLKSKTTIRLTTHHGIENNAIISNDGKSIAFTGQYEGSPEIYKMPIGGGVPIRLTYHHNIAIPMQWLSDEILLYSTRKYSTLPGVQLVKLNTSTLSDEIVPLAQASDGCFDQEGNLFFTRFAFQGSQTKRYKGGTAQSIWKFDGKSEASHLTNDFTGTSRQPMSYKDRIYYASDKNGTMNIWSMNKQGQDKKQHTHASGWDVLSPKIHNAKIVYQNGADIWIYDIESDKESKLDINLPSDFDQKRPRWIKNPGNSISSYSLSPDGNALSVTARGRIFVNRTNGDRWLEITRKSGIRYKQVRFIDNNTIAYLSDETGEFEIWSASVNGKSKPVQLTKNSKVLITNLEVDPTGKSIAYVDKDAILRIVDIKTKATSIIDTSDYFGYLHMTWSNDGQYLTFVKSNIGFGAEIWSYNTSDKTKQSVSSKRVDSYNPQWTDGDDWLYFVSDRTFNSKVGSPWGPRQPEPYYEKTAKIYALDLAGKANFPFLMPDPWLPKKENDKKETSNSAKGKNKKAASTNSISPINWNQAKSNLYEIPVGAKNIQQFAVAENHLYWSEYVVGDRNKTKLFSLKLSYAKTYKPTVVMEGNLNFELSADKKKILIFNSGEIYVGDANGSKINKENAKVNFKNWRFKLNPVEDWTQMFYDSWRMERDYFYDKNLHNVDWDGIKTKHAALLDRVTDREELQDLIAQMVGELSALHTFVYGGDKRRGSDNIQAGSLGALLTKDQNKGGYIINKIFQHDPDYPGESSPLNKPHLKINEGDIITAINNVPVFEVDHINQLLANKVGVPLSLSIKNSGGNSQDYMVTPIGGRSERNLRYTSWEYSRRQVVEQKSNNAIGYIHLRAMGRNDISSFVKQFYPVFDRQGLIIDVRHNNGGNIDSWILEKLLRRAWFFWKGRSGKPYWNMQLAFRGHLAVLCDESTASDGEAFAEGVKRLKLGTVIGTRTWGGEIWLTSSNRLVDNGIATAAEFGVYTADGKWIIEGHGVEPDIEIDNLPFETYNGKDAQLDKAIEFLQNKIKTDPVVVPNPPSYPDKSFNYDK